MAREVTLVDAGIGNIASVERALIQVGGAVRVTDDPDLVARARTVVFPGQSAFGKATQAIVDGAMGAALRMVIERGDPFLGICLGMQLLFDGSDENQGQEGLHVFPGMCRRFPDGMEVEAEPGAEVAEGLEPAEAQADTAHAQSMSPPMRSAGAAATATASEGGGGGAWGISTSEPGPTPTPTPTPPTVGGGRAAEAVAPAEAAAAPVRAPGAEPEPLLRRLKVPHMGWNEVEPTGDHYYFVHSYYVEAEKSEHVMWMSTYGGIRFPAAVRRDNVLGCQFHPEKSQRSGLKFLRAFLLGGWG
jgi:imidazoleglycerol phosphate synthase glutamine amidotransferase subunit HisH